MNWPTPRDLLAMNPNPAKIAIAQIVARFGISKGAASELRRLASRAPEVLARFHPSKAGGV